MSSHRVNAVEKDLEKFIKFLALKSTQVVVQSRLGDKVQTQCNPEATANDWFNIVIQDHPDVYAETKLALALAPGESILNRFPLCVEISLKTVDGDQMVLEVWSLDLQQTGGYKVKDEPGISIGTGSFPTNTSALEQQTLKASHSIYNRMGVLLKSLISLTRATPAYKLSRRQCPDSYGIYYRILVARPAMHTLGEGYKNVRIGQLNTIVGALTMSVAYRTKLTITPTSGQARNGEGNTIMLKSDHFRPSDSSTPTQSMSTGLKKVGSGTNGERKIIDLEKPLRPGAFTDIGKLKKYTEEDYVLPETPPFEWLLKHKRHESGSSGGCGSIESLNRKCESPAASPLTNEQNTKNINMTNNSNNNNNNNNNLTAFKSLENDEKSPDSIALSNSPTKTLFIPAKNNSAQSSVSSTTPAQPIDDEHFLKELNFPFASPTSHVNDLAKFYRDCYHAPPLRGLSEIQMEASGCSVSAISTISSTSSADSCIVDDLSRQLEQFETSLEDYDKLVSQLGLSGSSSTGSRSSGGLQMSN